MDDENLVEDVGSSVVADIEFVLVSFVDDTASVEEEVVWIVVGAKVLVEVELVISAFIPTVDIAKLDVVVEATLLVEVVIDVVEIRVVVLVVEELVLVLNKVVVAAGAVALSQAIFVAGNDSLGPHPLKIIKSTFSNKNY